MYKIKTLTQSDRGHTLHHNSVFNADDEWIVFDARNDDTKIAECSEIGIVNLNTMEEKIIYKTSQPSKYGPGVGAASFHPKENKVIFIHGLPDADEEKPYSMSRRFGMLVDLDKENQSYPADSRDMEPPYTKGSLQGGTHSHGWSPNGDLISFTYNDELIEPDLRTVGLMIKTDDVVKVDKLPGNIQGKYYAAIVAEVVSKAKNGSDQIEKAFDECWLDDNKIAFQGNIRNNEGELVTEVFMVEVDKQKILDDGQAVGKAGVRPGVPKGIIPRRISRSERGISNFRHWLRASPDGKFIYALGKDQNQNNQIIQCDISTGNIKYLSDFDFSISSPVNLNSKGDQVTFVANNNIYMFNLKSKSVEKLTDFNDADLKLQGAPVFSRDGKKIAFNQFVENNGLQNIQIKLIYLE